MKNRMVRILTAAALAVGMCQCVIAEESGGIQKLKDMWSETKDITESTMMLSVSFTMGEKEFSAGAVVRMASEDAVVDMIYLSIPDNEGMSYDLVSEEVLYICNDEICLNTDFIDDVMEMLSENDDFEDKDEEEAEAVDMLKADWISTKKPEKLLKLEYDVLTDLFHGFAAAHDAGSYTINLYTEDIEQVIERLDTQIVKDRFDNVLEFDIREFCMPYIEAIDSGKARDSQTEKEQKESKADKEYNAIVKQIKERLEDDYSMSEEVKKAVERGLEVYASICTGKDGAAGTYALEVTTDMHLTDDLRTEWKLDAANLQFNFVVSIEPAQEKIQIQEPSENIIDLETLLKELAEQGMFCD